MVPRLLMFGQRLYLLLGQRRRRVDGPPFVAHEIELAGLQGNRLGADPQEALAALARSLTNKLMHAPSVQLKKLSAEGRIDALTLAQELFALDEGLDKT